MSTSWIANLNPDVYAGPQPSWKKLERIDYCEQPVSDRAGSFMEMIRRLIGRKN